MRIKSLAQGENILMLGIEPSTFVSKIEILTTTPIVHYETFFIKKKFYFDQYLNLAASVSMNLQCESKYIKNEGTFKGYQPMFSPYINNDAWKEHQIKFDDACF